MSGSCFVLIPKAHAYFIAIHPFGDGNGRVGRALVMVQCLNARLMPPTFDGKNRAMYTLRWNMPWPMGAMHH
ncbi:hypothetical protein BMR07_02700 [Methylococcaceae bacterium CS1]|nr:hypothetical protein BMR10_17395 [Methylococcaceae bacterium CS4]TXK93765.1 hypothetical protein BMR11_16320 [Methylococcaceae bacterium CS5]TXL08249.1 hypothetical protein BMR07_02700 [Methylococcaceae bacterium CS1]TXL10021.1 hypothetical protein BMR08_10980 [Methylococcaceae bacterium CS2]